MAQSSEVAWQELSQYPAVQSVLIAREEMPSEGPVRAVFATDHSPYCAQCMRLFMQLNPAGISHMTLLTVHERSKHENLFQFLPHVKQDQIFEESGRAITQQNQQSAQWFSENGIPTSSTVVVGEVEESIHKFMEESGADLLIVGSQGHGFLERIMVGSTSLHEVIGERYPLLILRPPVQETYYLDKDKGLNEDSTLHGQPQTINLPVASTPFDLYL